MPCEHKKRPETESTTCKRQFPKSVTHSVCAHIHTHTQKPPTSRHDPAYTIYEELENCKASKHRIGENTRRHIYNTREEGARKTHKADQNKRFREEPVMTANDSACHTHEYTDEQISAWPMRQWQRDIKRHAMWGFLYRARRGGLVEKSKAYERMRQEIGTQATFFTRRYGEKYL